MGGIHDGSDHREGESSEEFMNAALCLFISELSYCTCKWAGPLPELLAYVWVAVIIIDII